MTAAERAVATIATDYLRQPPGPMLAAGLDARAAVLDELRRAPSSRQRPDLIRAAGYLSGVVAYAALNLSHPGAAEHAATAEPCWSRNRRTAPARRDRAECSQLGELDAAAAMLAPVLALPVERRISWLRRRVGRVPDLLVGPRYARSVTAAGLREAMRAFG